MEKEICGNCQWHRCQGDDWYCTNAESDNYGLETDYKDGCGDYEGDMYDWGE